MMCKGLILGGYTYIRLAVTRGYVGSSDDINASDCSSSSDIFLIAL